MIDLHESSGGVGAATASHPSRERSTSQARLVSAMEEVMEAMAAGQELDRETLLAKYADVSDELAECLSNLDFVQNVAPQLADEDTAHPASKIEHPASSRVSLGDFRINREIGRGGMGVVYEAEQLSLGRRVALKVLPFAAMLDKQQLARFKNEARAAATLDHPNIVAIYSVGVERGVHYYAMQLIEGQSLAQVVEHLRHSHLPLPPGEGRGEGALGEGQVGAASRAALPDKTDLSDSSPARLAGPTADTALIAALSTLPDFSSKEYYRSVAVLGIQAAEALDHAHQNGILHRDIKPANLLLECQTPSPLRGGLGRGSDDAAHLKLWITDFGLARMEQDAGRTMTGDILGTLRYMSPEQALAKRVVVDHRSDIYSLGVTLYELLNLQPAFTGDDRHELLRQIAFEEPRKLRQNCTRIPQDLETIILKAIEKNPSQRYGTAQEMAEDLRNFIHSQPIKAKPATLRTHLMKWSRRHPAGVRAALISVVVCAIAVAASTGWATRDQAARRMVAESAAQAALTEAERNLTESRWRESLSSIKRAEVALAGESAANTLRERVRQLRLDVDMVLRLEEIRLNQETVVRPATEDGSDLSQSFFDAEADRKYSQAFDEYGIKLDSLSTDNAVERIKQSAITLELAAALDIWSHWQKSNFPDNQGWTRLIEIAKRADPHPWRNRFREALGMDGDARHAMVRELAESIPVNDLTPRTISLVASILRKSRPDEASMKRLQAAQRLHPNDFWINYNLGCIYIDLLLPDAAIRFLTAALAIRPDSASAHNALGVALSVKGLDVEALEMFQQGLRLDPSGYYLLLNVGHQYGALRRYGQSAAMFQEFIRLYYNTAPRGDSPDGVLHDGSRDDASIASRQQPPRRQPNLASAYLGLGYAARGKGAWDDALAFGHKAIDTDSDHPYAYGLLGEVHLANGSMREAARSFSKLAEVKPDDHGVALRAAFLQLADGNRAEYEAICHRMLDRFGGRQDPAAARRTCWACAIASPPVGKVEQLVQLADLAVQDKNITTNSHRAITHRERGLVAYRAGDWKEALEWSEKSRRLTPQAERHHRDYNAMNLLVEAMALHQLGRTREAQAAYDQSVALAHEEFPNYELGIQSAAEKWLDWIAIDVLRREAETTLSFVPIIGTDDEIKLQRTPAAD
jgi:serine/threonine protein kinase/Flp pilus assembly protein TadD